MKNYIYCLFDINDNVIYVGKTKLRLEQRLKAHIKKLNENLYIYELDCIENNDWRLWEEYWIQQFKAWGFKLLNKNKGGGGPEKHSDETKKLMSEQRKGRIFSDAHKTKLSEALKGKVLTDTHKANIGKTSLGRTMSDEAKKQISKKLKEMKRAPISNSFKSKFNNEQLKDIIEMYNNNVSLRKIAVKYNSNHCAIKRHIKNIKATI